MPKSILKPRPAPVKPNRKAKNNLYKKVATAVKNKKKK